MRKRILQAVLIMLLTAGSTVATAADSIILWRANGEKITITIGEHPKITFGNGDVIITTVNGEVAYPANELVRCTCESTADGIESVRAGSVPSLAFDGVDVIITGLPEASSVTVYSVAGREQCSVQADGNGRACVPMASMEAGIYIFKTKTGNFKIRKP